MSKKHRRDVIIARIVFVLFLLVMGVLIWKLAAWGVGRLLPEKDSTQTQTQTESETESQTYFVIDPNAPATETEIETETETETEAVEVQAKTTTGIRMRKEPNTNCDILTVIGEGTEVTVLGEDGEWSQVSFNGLTGYVKTEYLQILE